MQQVLADDIGDFVVARADGVIAYQLAVVVDDADQGVTEVVRGADLLLSTPRQLHLQRLLGLPTPTYLHHPVAVAADGSKLSKQHRAAPLDLDRPGANLHARPHAARSGTPGGPWRCAVRPACWSGPRRIGNRRVSVAGAARSRPRTAHRPEPSRCYIKST